MPKLTRNHFSPLIAFILCLIALDASAIDLFGKKISKTISYRVLNSEFNAHAPLTSNQSNALLAIEAHIRGISEKKILKKLGVSIANAKFSSNNDFIKPLSAHEVVLASTTSESNIAGIMEFTDKIGRTVKFWFDLNLNTKEENLEVIVLALNLMIQANTQVELFLVPEDGIDTTTVYAAKNYADLYKNINSIAINNKNTAPTGMQEYLAIAFHKEVLAPDINIKMKLSTQQNGISGNEDKSRYQLIKNSWLVTILPLHLDLANDKKWIKITMQSNSDSYNNELEEERLIRSFPLNL